jgi:hypothetical protein
VVAHLVEPQAAGLGRGVLAAAAERAEVVVPVAARDVVEARDAGFVGGAYHGVQGERARAVAGDRRLDERAERVTRAAGLRPAVT